MPVLLWTEATMLNTELGLPRLLSVKTQHIKTQKLLVWQREFKKILRRCISRDSIPQGTN